MERFPRNKTSRIEPLNLVGTARCAVRAAFSGTTMPPADSRGAASQRDVPTEVRFMGRPAGDYSLVWNVRRWPVAGIVTAYDLPSAATDSLM